MNMLLHFYCFPQLFSNEERKILFALFYTVKPTGLWAHHRVNDFLTCQPDEREDETQQIFHHFDNLITALKEAFEFKDFEQAAAIKIQRLRQTDSAEKYAANFKSLSYQLN